MLGSIRRSPLKGVSLSQTSRDQTHGLAAKRRPRGAAVVRSLWRLAYKVMIPRSLV